VQRVVGVLTFGAGIPHPPNPRARPEGLFSWYRVRASALSEAFPFAQGAVRRSDRMYVERRSFDT